MYTIDGAEITVEEIKTAIKEQRAVILWSHGEWKNIGSLAIYDTAEEAEIEAERDTRDECYSMADEVWCYLAENEKEALRAAKGLLSTS